MRLGHGTWVVIADGEKFLALHNEGKQLSADLRVIEKDQIDNPPDREQSSDRPGRMPNSSARGRSALEETDWHRVEKKRFAQDLAKKLHGWAAEGRYKRLVLIADPRTLGELKADNSNMVKERLVLEIGKDLTNAPVGDIEAVLNKAEG